MRKHNLVVRRKRGELIGMRAEGKSGQFGNLFRGALGKFRMRIQPRADRGSANREIVKSIENLLQSLDVAIQQTCPAAEFLAKS